jgi:hypothetical protein
MDEQAGPSLRLAGPRECRFSEHEDALAQCIHSDEAIRTAGRRGSANCHGDRRRGAATFESHVGRFPHRLHVRADTLRPATLGCAVGQGASDARTRCGEGTSRTGVHQQRAGDAVGCHRSRVQPILAWRLRVPAHARAIRDQRAIATQPRDCYFEWLESQRRRAEI